LANIHRDLMVALARTFHSPRFEKRGAAELFVSLFCNGVSM
jgi:hypothetical protein